MLRAADALVDAGGHRLAHRDQLFGAAGVAGQRHLRRRRTRRARAAAGRRARASCRRAAVSDASISCERLGLASSRAGAPSARAARARSRRASGRRSADPRRPPRRISRQRRSMCSIAATAGSRRRSADQRERIRSSDPHGTNAIAVVGIGDSARKVTVVITPSVPSDPMNRSIRSMPAPAWYPAEHLDDVRHPVGGDRHVDRPRAVGTQPAAPRVRRDVPSARIRPRGRPSAPATHGRTGP